MSIEKKLAIHIKELRIKNNLTQAQLAEISGIEYKHIQALESLKTNHSPTLRTVEKLSSAFGLAIWAFLKPITKK